VAGRDSSQRYPPIGDYGFIADCHSAALISRGGSIDWCCLPRIDSASVFGRLLDWDHGGRCELVPEGEHETARRYLEGTLVLETTYTTDTGRARLLDTFVMREGGREDPARQILRVVEGIEGRVDLAVTVAPRFDYGAVLPWVRSAGRSATAIGGDQALVLGGDVELEVADDHDLTGGITVRSGDRARLSIDFALPEDVDRAPRQPPAPDDVDRQLDETVAWWRWWSRGTRRPAGDVGAALGVSATVLKGLTNARTGAMAAAATTSLPEVAGGGRNWDYRATWIRDSTWAARSLAELGHHREAEGFRRFAERSAADSASELQVVYGIGGSHRLTEMTLDLEGYRGARPVRIGNAAAEQDQHDVYGEMLQMAWLWQQRGHQPDRDDWRFLADLVETAADLWTEPDRGMWELRRDRRHNVHSKVMCWAAIDRGLRIAEANGLEAPTERWEKVREEIRGAVESEGFDRGRGVFVGTFDGSEVDASLLLLPQVGFVGWDDERMVRTVDAIRADLDADGLVHRFRPEEGQDEGAFVPCSFWLAECLARQGRRDDAESTFRRASETANDLGLLSEEFDPRSGEQLGNFPQGLSHLSHISAAMALAKG
jgi:GH15 family glucan-1,4-alpha-glucosidase